MRIHPTLLAILALPLLFGAARANAPQAPVAAPALVEATELPCDGDIKERRLGLYDSATACMTEHALKHGVEVDTATLAYASAPDVFLVTTAIAGLELIEPGDVYKGQNMLLVKLEPGNGYDLDLPAGVYTVEMTVDQDTHAASAQFIDENGRVAYATDAVTLEVETPEAGKAKPKVEVSAHIGKKGFELDIKIVFGAKAYRLTTQMNTTPIEG